MGKHFNAILIHTCTIQRSTPATSTSGEPIPSWADVDTLVLCRYIQQRQSFPNEGLTAEHIRVDLVLLKAGTDIQEDDRISSIVLAADSTTVLSGPLTVTSVIRRNTTETNHLSVAVEAID